MGSWRGAGGAGVSRERCLGNLVVSGNPLGLAAGQIARRPDFLSDFNGCGNDCYGLGTPLIAYFV